MTEDYLTKLIDDHWEYVEGILRAHRLEDPDVNLAKFHYKTAFKHGYKRAKEDIIGETTKLEMLAQGYREATIAAQNVPVVDLREGVQAQDVYNGNISG